MSERIYTNRKFLDALEERVLIYDGAMGTSIQLLDLTEEDFGGKKYFGCNDYLVITRPHAIESIHRSFLEAGVDVIETNTFRANRLTLQEYDLQHLLVIAPTQLPENPHDAEADLQLRVFITPSFESTFVCSLHIPFQSLEKFGERIILPTETQAGTKLKARTTSNIRLQSLIKS